MFYRIVRPFATLALKTNFRRIYFSNAQVIPKNKPVILAVNHPSAFLEPCLMACLLPQPLHFLVRGDLFTSNLARKALGALHMIPIYRFIDGGYGKLKHNFSTFELCYEKLEANQTIMILAEGNTIQEKRLRPIQKGSARIAFGAIGKNENLDIKIIPVGVNYTYADQFRSDVMFEFGAPISVQDYKKEFNENPKRAIVTITAELAKRLKKHVIIIDKVADEELTEKLFVLKRNEFETPYFPIVSRKNNKLRAEKNIADQINAMDEKEKNDLNEKVNDYLEQLKRNQIDDWTIAQKNAAAKPKTLMIILGFLPSLFGYLGNYLPIFIANIIAANFVKYIEFMASVKIAVAIGAFVLYYLTLMIFSIQIGNFMLVILVFMLPFFGYYSLMYKEYYKKWQSFNALKKVDGTNLENLLARRASIWRFLQ